MLAQVHRRARAISTRRIAWRTAPAAVALVAIVASLLTVGDGRSASVRAADEGTTATTSDTDGGSGGGGQPTSPGDSHENHGGSGAGISLEPASDERVEVRVPDTLPPLEPGATPAPEGPYLVRDGEGDHLGDNAGVDLLYGDLAYHEPKQTLVFSIGVTSLATAPDSVSYTFSFTWDGRVLDVRARRRLGNGPEVFADDHRCESCTVSFDNGRNVIRLHVPLDVLNETIEEWASSYQPVPPFQAEPSPPLTKGSTIRGFDVRAQAYQDGEAYFIGDPSRSDQAYTEGQWTIQ